MVGKGSAHWQEENLQKRKFNSEIADLWSLTMKLKCWELCNNEYKHFKAHMIKQ